MAFLQNSGDEIFAAAHMKINRPTGDAQHAQALSEIACR